MLLGPSAYVILDAFGQTGYIVWSFAYPAILGLVFAAIGYWRFKASDLV